MAAQMVELKAGLSVARWVSLTVDLTAESTAALLAVTSAATRVAMMDGSKVVLKVDRWAAQRAGQ